MLKFAIGAGICFEWAFGPAINSLASFGSASIRAVVAAALAWMVLEAVQALWRTVMLLDDRPPRPDPRSTTTGR